MDRDSCSLNNTKQPITYLIDASIYVFRAWYTWPKGCCDKKGESIHAVLGFMDFVFQVLVHSRANSAYVAFAFDESQTQSMRREIYPEYKKNRRRIDPNLHYQFQLCRRFIRLLGIVEASSPRYEADDLIATWTQQQVGLNRHVYILSGDKDLAQLVGEKVTWWEYVRDQQLDVKAVHKKFGVQPNQIAAQLALAGDKADNIRGVPEIGMATAAKLLRKFGTIEQLLTSIDEIGRMKVKMAMRWQIAIQTHKAMISVYYQLTCLCEHVPTVVSDLKPQPINQHDLEIFYRDLQLDEPFPVCWDLINKE